jgi:hypothetical protein
MFTCYLPESTLAILEDEAINDLSYVRRRLEAAYLPFNMVSRHGPLLLKRKDAYK